MIAQYSDFGIPETQGAVVFQCWQICMADGYVTGCTGINGKWKDKRIIEIKLEIYDRSVIFVRCYTHMTKAEKTRQFIIEKSAPIFNVKGIAGTAMSDIMEATNLAKGSLYLHFENKDALALCVVDYNLKFLVDRAHAAANKYKTVKDKLAAFIDITGDPSNPPLEGGCPMLNFGTEADDTYPAVRKKVSKAMDSLQLHIAKLVEEGIAAGEFKKNWNAEQFSVRAFSMIEGGILMSRVSGKPEKLKMIIAMLKKEIKENSY